LAQLLYELWKNLCPPDFSRLLYSAIPLRLDFDRDEEDLLEADEFLDWFKLLSSFEKGLTTKD
jgi:hypothetical protein